MLRKYILLLLLITNLFVGCKEASSTSDSTAAAPPATAEPSSITPPTAPPTATTPTPPPAAATEENSTAATPTPPPAPATPAAPVARKTSPASDLPLRKRLKQENLTNLSLEEVLQEVKAKFAVTPEQEQEISKIYARYDFSSGDQDRLRNQVLRMRKEIKRQVFPDVTKD